MKRFYSVLGLALSSLIAGCASQPSGYAQFMVAVPYRTVGAAFGGTSSSGIAVLPAGNSPAFFAAQGLQMSLQKFKSGLVVPDILQLKDADRSLQWQSDIGLLSVDQLTEYNTGNVRPALGGYLFGVAFSGRMIIVDNEIRYTIETRLHRRGAVDNWKAVAEQDYDGSFFSMALAKDLNSALLATHGARP